MMEPRSWQLMQGLVIAAALAIGISAAVWYENRPLPSRGAITAKVAPAKKAVATANDGIIPGYAPVPSVALGDSSASDASAAATRRDTGATMSVPSQSSVDSWQRTAVDPVARPDGIAPSDQIRAGAGRASTATGLSNAGYAASSSSIAPQAQDGYSAPGAFGETPPSQSRFGVSTGGNSSSGINPAPSAGAVPGIYANPGASAPPPGSGASDSSVSPIVSTQAPSSAGGSYMPTPTGP